MQPLFFKFVLRLLAGGIPTYLLWRALGATGLILGAPILAVALARPLIDLTAGLFGAMRQRALSSVKGRYFSYRGIPLDIAEDEHHTRWLSLGDVRKIITGLPRDAVLEKQWGKGVQHDPALGGSRIQADTLLAYLEQAHDARSIKFRNWLQQEVAFPAEKARQG